MVSETVDCASPSVCAARVIVPTSATATKTRSCLSSMPGFIRRNLPDPAPLLGRPHHRRTRLACERLLELRQVRERADDAVLRNRMRVALHEEPLRFDAHRGSLDLPERDEEL